jgi:hypothetical protein
MLLVREHLDRITNGIEHAPYTNRQRIDLAMEFGK